MKTLFTLFLMSFSFGSSALANPLFGTWEGTMHYEDSDAENGYGHLKVTVEQIQDLIKFTEDVKDTETGWANGENFVFTLKDGELFQNSTKVGSIDDRAMSVDDAADKCVRGETEFSVKLSIQPNGALHYEANEQDYCGSSGRFDYGYSVTADLQKVP